MCAVTSCVHCHKFEPDALCFTRRACACSCDRCCCLPGVLLLRDTTLYRLLLVAAKCSNTRAFYARTGTQNSSLLLVSPCFHVDAPCIFEAFHSSILMRVSIIYQNTEQIKLLTHSLILDNFMTRNVCANYRSFITMMCTIVGLAVIHMFIHETSTPIELKLQTNKD